MLGETALSAMIVEKNKGKTIYIECTSFLEDKIKLILYLFNLMQQLCWWSPKEIEVLCLQVAATDIYLNLIEKQKKLERIMWYEKQK